MLYRGHGGLVAHECILDLREFKSVTVEDVAKRLMDYGFHAPTISWPVPGTMMVEPTESESKAELDRFCEALISIHAEIQAIESGQADRHNNLLKNAPHTADMLAAEPWNHPYTREQACFPAKWLRDHKFWPAVGRIDNVYRRPQPGLLLRRHGSLSSVANRRSLMGASPDTRRTLPRDNFGSAEPLPARAIRLEGC